MKKTVKSDYKVKPSQQLLNQEQVFAKKSKLQQAEHDLIIANMTIQQLKTHVGYMIIVALIFIILGIALSVIAVIED